MTIALLLVMCLHGSPAARTSPSAAGSPEADLDPRAVLVGAQSKFDQAVAFGKQGSPEAQKLYREALTAYESISSMGVRSAGLYYDIANTQLRLGDVGRAIVNYRRALRLRPGDPNIRKNLESARKLCEVRLAPPAADAVAETLLFWHYGTSLGGRTRVGLMIYAAFWLAMLALRRSHRGAPALKWLAGGLGAICLCVGASVAWDRLVAANRPEGALVAESAVLRKGNGDYYDPQLTRPLSAGVEFRVLESREDVKGAEWHRVQLTDGKEGWVRADEAELI